MNNEPSSFEEISITAVEPVCERGSDVPGYYRVTARVWGLEHEGGMIRSHTTWLGIQQIDGSLGCTGWVDATQWVDPMCERVLGVKAAVALGERILAAAVL